MNEFWNQGDEEKKLGLPISFLCDREKVNVPNAQQGFITGIILPLMDAVKEVMPGMGYLAEQGRQNREEWKEIAEKEAQKEEEEKKSSQI